MHVVTHVHLLLLKVMLAKKPTRVTIDIYFGSDFLSL
jgi:hypothetical protein